VITDESAQAELDAIIQATVARGPVLGRGLPETTLSSREIAELKALHASGKWSMRKLGRRFGVSHYIVGRMLTRSE
jgi:hypothetical protein